MTLRGLNFALGTFAILVACSAHEMGGPVTPSVWLVSLTAPVSTIKVKDRLVINAQALDRNGIPLDTHSFVWKSENTAVATVDQNGVVLGVSAGSAVITASSEGIGGAFTVGVTPLPAPIVVISSTPVFVGMSIQARAVTVNPATNNLFNAPAKWRSSDPAVARIDSATGLLDALAVGTARIDATYEGLTGSSEVTVLAPALYVVTNFPSVFVGMSIQARAFAVNPATKNLSLAPAKWRSSDPAVARIDSATGLLDALSVGTARIDATYQGLTGSIEVTVLASSQIRFREAMMKTPRVGLQRFGCAGRLSSLSENLAMPSEQSVVFAPEQNSTVRIYDGKRTPTLYAYTKTFSRGDCNAAKLLPIRSPFQAV